MSKISDALDLIQGSRRPDGPAENGQDETVEAKVIAELINAADDHKLFFADNPILNVDMQALREAYLVPPECDEQLLSNQYRDIKRPLVAHAFGKRATQIERGNLIMVTSSIAGEGKTFTSVNLALSMAQERDYFTLLVDADAAKPQLSDTLGLLDEPGLLDVLEDPDVDLRSAVRPTDIDRLYVLPSGRPRNNATELLSSDAMDRIVELLQHLASRHLVVLDAPPLLQTSEAKVLARIAGQILLVVRAEHTPREDVDAALSILNEDQAVNLLLNQARYTSGKFQYGYGAGYQPPGQKAKSEPEDETKSEIFE